MEEFEQYIILKGNEFQSVKKQIKSVPVIDLASGIRNLKLKSEDLMQAEIGVDYKIAKKLLQSI